MTEFNSLKNRFLVAMPNMRDPNFTKAVIYICEHTEEGALGIIINQPISISFTEVLENMELKTNEDDVVALPVCFGGPLQQERGFVIHSPVGKWRASLTVSDKVAVTVSRDVIEAVAKGKGPKKVLTCLGYAGWDAGQLEKEMAQNMWLDTPVDQKIIFKTPFKNRWEAAAQLLGIDLTFMSGDAGHA